LPSPGWGERVLGVPGLWPMLRSPGVEGGDEIFGVDIRADQVLFG
jgi:hypothetical protein